MICSGVTFFTTLKDMDDKTDSLGQESAVFSWRREQFQANPILVIGDGVGVPEFCQRNGLTLVPEVERASNRGLLAPHPMLKSLFQQAIKHAKTDYLCLMNSDIIVSPGFHTKLGSLLWRYPGPFVTGVRYDIALAQAAVTEEAYLALWGRKDIAVHHGGGSDFFAMSKVGASRLVQVMPDYVMGAAAWDNWLHWAALHLCESPICTIDYLKILHPNHVYRQLSANTKESIYEHPAVKHNMAIYKGSKEKASTAGGRWIRL